jgi:hypothetical protein
MFDHNKQLQKAIDTLYEKMKSLNYGDRFSWNKLAQMSDLSTKDMNKVYYVTNKVCLMLMKNDQKYLETEHKYGKRIINPQEHQLIAKKTANKSVRIYKKAGAVLASTNMEELTDEQKKEVIEAANRYNTLEMFTTEMLKKKQIGIAGKTDVRTASLFLDAIKLFTDKDK